MNNLKDCDYVIEIYSDKYNTLRKSIMYKYGDNRERDYLRTTINPNLTKLINVRYYNKNNKILYEEKFGIISNNEVL